MRTLMIPLVLGTALAAMTLTACKKDDACSTLTKKICDGGSIACDKVGPWLDAQMTGPKHEALSASQKSGACNEILNDKDALTGFTESAKSALTANK